SRRGSSANRKLSQPHKTKQTMNLTTIKTNAEIEKLLSPLPVSIERREHGGISRIIIGTPSHPTAIIQKDGTYSEWIEICAIARKSIYKSETELCGTKITAEFECP